MPIETFDYVGNLNASNPASSDDLVDGDNHIRGIKLTLTQSFPSVTGAVTGTHTQLNALTAGTAATLCPTGMVADFVFVPASGWLECNGQAVSRTTFSALFGLIGTTYGSGNGSTTFNVPDATARYRRQRGGNASTVHTLQADTTASHTHTGTTASNGAHTHTGSTGIEASHTHPYQSMGSTGFCCSTPVAGTNSVSGFTPGSASTSPGDPHIHSIGSDGAHTHTFTTDTTGSTETRPVSWTVITCVKT